MKETFIFFKIRTVLKRIETEAVFTKREIIYKLNVNERTFVSASLWRKSIYATVGGERNIFRPFALKSLNYMEKIKPWIMYSSCYTNHSPTIVSYNCPTDANYETLITVFNNELFSLVRHIPKHNVQIINENMNA